jgi:hypothetical protein
MPTTIKRGDTWPPLRGLASDEDGPINMTTADSVTLLAKSGATLISGTVVPLAAPDGDGFNWSYTWGAADTNIVGEYSVELEIDWGGGQYETIPNDGVETLTIIQDQGGHL